MRQLFIRTDKAYISALPRYAFTGKIIVVQSSTEAERAIRILRNAPILGIDTETRPTFKRGQSHKVALLQIATENICFLFRLNEIGFLPCLSGLLSNPNILKIGLSLHDDFMMLKQREQSFTPACYIDLQEYVKDLGIKDMSLQKLYANVFHMRISKGSRLSNWEADILTEAQKIYAATDAVTCIHLYKELRNLKEYNNFYLIDREKSSSLT